MITLVALLLAMQDAATAQAALKPSVSMPSISAESAPAPAIPVAEAVSTPSFMLSQPRQRLAGDTVRLEGTVCRRPNRSLISPTRVEIDHLSATGGMVDTTYAYLPEIRQREDQRCVHYGAKLKTPPQAGDRVRVCLATRQGACSKGG